MTWKPTHRMSRTKLYKVWTNMKFRCYNPSCPHFSHYGARGILICDEWKNDFSAFMGWAKNSGYKSGLTLDRIDNNKGYSPDNCRWVDFVCQANNTRRNVFIEKDGIQKTPRAWARELGLHHDLICTRLKNGWDEKYLLMPSGFKRPR